MGEQQSLVIETKDLLRVYGDGEKIYALDRVNLRVAAGEMVAVMGPSGSGKSTLLNMIGALDIPTSGEVSVNGQNLAEIEDKDDFRSHTVGFVFQLHNLLPTLTALENVEIPMMGTKSKKERRDRALYLLSLVGLADRLDHLPNQLSGGQRQRVAVARALANNPALILADEPTGNLDSTAGQDLMDLIREINQKEGTTFLIVTHDQNVARRTDRIVVMQDGKIIREDIVGSPLVEDLKLWRYSNLGQRILNGSVKETNALTLSPAELDVLTSFLTKEG
ncbi:MAG: ABC transporter ATP-binding protein [Anaerolineales bacterium]|nr:ABC transporter ATP-binding protein [Anaerolineales bacterium]